MSQLDFWVSKAFPILICLPDLLSTRPLQDLSPSSSAQALEELFPRYTSLRPGPPLNPPDFQGLRDALDSEHTRRKVRYKDFLLKAANIRNRAKC